MAVADTNCGKRGDSGAAPNGGARQTAAMGNAMRSLKRQAKRVLSLLAPETCAFCAGKTRNSACCQRCFALLPRNRHCCQRCANPLRVSLPDGVHCAACQREPPIYIETCAPMLYEFPIDTAIKSLKFNGELFYLPALGELMASAVLQRALPADAVVPVPLHYSRRIRRGFNQAEGLGKIIAQKLELPLLRNTKRKRRTRTQSDLQASERAGNVHNAFSVAKSFCSRRPLIVDDVMTTGETCNAFARALQDAGAEEIRVLVIARARAPG